MTISPCSFAGKVSPALFTTKTSLPGIARPTGNAEYFSKIERSIRTEVVATVASVGPYMFHTWARGKRSSKRAAVCAASVSPQKRKRRMRGSIPSENFSSTRHICENDGVETHDVEPEFPSARSSIIGFATKSRLMLNSVLPVVRLQYKSITERSNEKGAVFKKVSPR